MQCPAAAMGFTYTNVLLYDLKHTIEDTYYWQSYERLRKPLINAKRVLNNFTNYIKLSDSFSPVSNPACFDVTLIKKHDLISEKEFSDINYLKLLIL